MNRFYFTASVALGVVFVFFLGTLIPWGNIGGNNEPVTNPETHPVTLTCNVTGISSMKMKNNFAYFIDTEDCGSLHANPQPVLEVKPGHQYELTTGEGPANYRIIHSAELIK